MSRGVAIAALAVALALGLTWRSAAFRPSPHTASGSRQSPPATEIVDRETSSDASLVETSPTDEHVDRVAATLARLRAELRFWETHMTGRSENKEADAELSRRLHELDALITDENCADIVCEFSTTELQSPFGLAALRRWLALEPGAAARAIALRPDATDDLAFLVADTLIERPSDLLDLERQLPNAKCVQTMLQHAAGAALTIDPRVAIDFAQHLTDAEVRATLLPQIAHHWVQREPDAALEWIANFPDSSARESLVSASALALANVDPARAAEWLIRGITDRAALQKSLGALIGAWSAADIDGAQKWAAALSDPVLRSDALRIVTNCRTQCVYDPADAAL